MATEIVTRESFALTPPENKQPSTMDLLDYLVKNNGAIEAIQCIAELQDKQRKQDAELAFNEMLSQCQQEIKRVVPDADGPKKKFASYKALDKEARPVYTRYGFSLSFGTLESTLPEHILVICDCSRGLHTRRYQIPMPTDGKGPQGAAVLSKSDAVMGAVSRGCRKLLACIFNIAIGDDDPEFSNGELADTLQQMEMAFDKKVLWKLFNDAVDKFDSNPGAIKAINAAKKKREGELK